jgi:hypothetical protein
MALQAKVCAEAEVAKVAAELDRAKARADHASRNRMAAEGVWVAKLRVASRRADAAMAALRKEAQRATEALQALAAAKHALKVIVGVTWCRAGCSAGVWSCTVGGMLRKCCVQCV